MTKRATHQMRRGFTLIELMIVVAIVGILAVLGIVGYRKLIVSAHTSEATHMVQSIRVAEEAYHAEAQTYVSTSKDGVSDFFPVSAPLPATLLPWITPAPSSAAACTGAGTGTHDCFGLLPVHTDGPVMYGYATVAGSAGAITTASIAAGSNTISLGGMTNSPVDYYWITACGDPAGQGASYPYSWVVANSFTNELFVHDQ